MATTTSKVQWITTAFAVAAAATLVPIAFADPTDSDSDSGGAAVGSSAGQAPSRSSRTNRERPKSTIGAPSAIGAPQTGSNESAAGSSSGSADSNGGAAAGSSSSSSGSGSGASSQSPGIGRASTDVSAPESEPSSPITSPDVPSPTADVTAPLAVEDEVTIIEVPLVADPDLQAATFGWMQNLNVDVCVLGLSQRITGQQSVMGSYATSSVSYNSSGCG